MASTLQRHRARKNFFSRLRRLAPWRSRTRLGRATAVLLSMLLALMMLGTAGPAYAEGEDVAPTEAEMSTLAAADEVPAPAEEQKAPAEEQKAPAEEQKAPVQEEHQGKQKPEGLVEETEGTDDIQPPAQELSTVSSMAALAAVVRPTPDWSWRGGATVRPDPIDDKDNTTPDTENAYTGGQTTEGTTPDQWLEGGSVQDKADISEYYVNVDSIGDILVSVGFTNLGTGGNVGYSIELNQKANSTNEPARPNRTVGDLLLRFDRPSGSTVLETGQIFEYRLVAAEGQTCEPIKNAASQTVAYWCLLASDAIETRASTDGFSGEARVNLTDVFDGLDRCAPSFATVNIRSTSSMNNWVNTMSDYVAPVTDQVVPATCATLIIEKFEKGTNNRLTGAEYDVYSGTGADKTLLYDDLTEGAAADKDTTANDGVIKLTDLEPGAYTIIEVQAPANHLLPPDNTCTDDGGVNNCRTHVVNLGKSETFTVKYFDPKEWAPLTAKKTATGDYDATYAWNITKGVRYGNDAFAGTASKSSAAASESFDWKVSVGEGARTEVAGTHEVTGAITIRNTNDAAVLATISESLDGCIYYDPSDTDPPLTPLIDAAGAAGFQVSVPANGETAFQYKCEQPNRSATSNTATISVDRSDYPRSQGDVGQEGTYDAAVTTGAGNTLSPSITWTEHNPDGTKTIQVTDVLKDTTTTHQNSGAPWTHTWGVHSDTTWDATAQKYVHAYSSPVSADAGECASVTNTARITETGQTAEATATHCRGAALTVIKNDTESLVRTYPWKITKDRSEKTAAEIDVDPETGEATAYFDIRVQADGAAEDSDWLMTGEITVTNPNDWQSVTLTDLTDVYEGFECTIDDWNTADKTIEAGTSQEYGYTCDFGDTKPPYTGTNRAVASWSAAAASTATDESAPGEAEVEAEDWDLRTENHKTVTVKDDKGTADPSDDVTVGAPITWAEGLDVTREFSMTVSAPAGKCKTWMNSAWLVGDQGATVAGPDEAEVRVCNPAAATGSKTATATFTRDYDWEVVKQVRVDANSAWVDLATFTGDSYSHEFEYRVVVKRNGVTDSAWKMSGNITVHNPNADSNIDPITVTVSEPATIGGVAATCVINDGDATTPANAAAVTIASGGADRVLPYTCDLAAAPPDDTRNSATIAWGDGEGESVTVQSPEPGVDFTTPTTEIDKTVNVIDDGSTPGLLIVDDVTLGTVTWDQAAGDGHTFPVYKDMHTAAVTGCSPNNQWTNTATAYGVNTATVQDADSATAAICPNPATWTVAKDSNSADGSRIEPGTPITYTLTVTHTAGVPATGVTAIDDLSGLLPDHASYTGLHADSAGEAGDVTAPDAGNDYKLTWDVGDLAIGATETLKFVVTVDADAWGVELPNLVTSPGSTNCPSPTAELPEECTTDHETKDQPLLTLVKNVDDNGTGANDPADAWNLSADGPTDLTVKSGTRTAVDPGTYVLSEDEGPGAGMYEQLGWKCGDDTEFRDPESVMLVSDQVATCTVYNKAVKPRLTLVKELDRSADPGAPGEKADWDLRADHAGTAGIDLQGDGGASGAVDKVGSYALSEVRNASVKPGWTDGTTWSCGPNATAVTEISLSLGAEVTCTITNKVSKGTWSRSKSSNPGDGATVKPGDEIVYHLTATRNPGGSDPRDIQLVDDLSDVLEHATFVGITDASGNVGATPANVDVPNGDDTTLEWDIAVLSQTEHLYYKVVVDAGEYGVDFGNVVTGAGSDCLTDCDTEHHTPSYSLDKSTEAPERVAPGATLTYTLTVRNTSNAKVEGFSVTDDLAGQTYVEDARVEGNPIPDCDAAPVCLDGTDLHWKFPTLQPEGQDGDSATLTYTVKVKADAFGVDIDNLATPGPGGECIEGEDPECTTHHETKDKPRLTLVKDVENGTTDGKAAPEDFTLSATPVDVPDAGSQTQQVMSGPGGGAGQVVNQAALPGEYELDETHVDHYTQGLWECRPTAVPGDWTAAGDLGANGTVELALDADVTCRVTNTADGGKYSIAKSSDQDGEEVLPGSEIVYTLTARWVDGVRMEDVVVRDEVTDVIDDADLDESDLPANAVLVTEGDRTFIEWTIPLLEDSDGSRQATLSYSVTVNADAWSTTLRNVVTPVTEDGTCEEGNDCETTTTTPDLPKLALVKEMQQGVGTPTAVKSDWILSADPDAQVGGGQGTESGAGGFAGRPVWPGTYELGESDNPGSDGVVDDYSPGDWSCVDNTTQQTVFGGLDGAELELAPNDDVTCTIVNTRDPKWAVGKTNDRGDGTTVLPGQEIAYTLTVHHTAGVKPTGIVVHDDLSDVLDDATMVTTFPASGGAVTFDGSTQVLTWNVPAFEGDATQQSFTYVVRVRDDAAGVTLVNAVTSPGSNCPPALSLAAVLTDEEVAQLDCSTSNPVPAWTLDKDSEPLSEEFVDGGDEITYSLLVTNTSDAVLEGATVVDDLSAVLDNAVLDEDSFLVDGVAPAAGDVVFDDASDTLTWSVPTIAPGGAPVELTYVVRINTEFEAGTFFENVAAPGDSANPVNNTGRCVAEGECSTRHGTQEPSSPEEPPTEPPTANPPANPGTNPPSSTVAGPLPPSDGFLPSTGGPARWLVPGAVALLMVGLALVLLERRRRRVD